MADSACYIELASNAGDFFSSAAQDDILIHPHYATQKILIGNSNSQIPSITVTSNAVGILKSSPAYTLDITGDINFTGTFRKNGTPYVGSQWSNNNSNVFLGADSNVGIGMSNPYERLIINGNCLVASNDAYFSVTAPGVSPSLGICKKSGSASMFVFTSNYNNTFANNMKFGMLTGTHLSNIATVSPVEYMVLTNSGNLGIGNSAPSYKLDVTGTTKTNILVSGSNSSFYNPSIPIQAFSASDGSQSIQLDPPCLTLIRHGVTGWSLVGPSNGRTRFSINDTSTGNPGSEYFTILQGGNTGVGISNPSYKLDVSGVSRILGDSNAFVVQTTLNSDGASSVRRMSFKQTGFRSAIQAELSSGTWQASDILINPDGGNVGIGMNSPAYKLDVVSNIRVDTLVAGNIGGSAVIAHSNNFTSCNFALCQSLNGQTYINSATGRTTVLQINNVDQVYINTGGLGVGVVPAYKLDVNGTGRVGSALIGEYGGGFAQFSHCNFGIGNSGYALLQNYNGNTMLNCATGQNLNFRVNNIDQMVMNTNGLGIGTTNPAYKLDVNGNINYTGTLSKSGVAVVSSQWTSSACNVYVGSTSNVGIGTTAPGYTLHVVGTIYTSGDIIAFSDGSAKSNLEVISEPLSKVRQLTGYTYNMPDSVLDTTKLTSKYTGLIAQQVMQVLPEAVHKDTDGKLSIAYGNIMGLVVEAIKEVDDKYKEEIQTLKNQMAQVMSKLENLYT